MELTIPGAVASAAREWGDAPALADPRLADPGLADPGLADPVLADPGLANSCLGRTGPGSAIASWTSG